MNIWLGFHGSKVNPLDLEIYSWHRDTTYHAPFIEQGVSNNSFRKFAQTNFPQVGFELRSLGPQVGY